MSTPREQNFFMPAECYPHECCWMQWPYQNPNFDSYGEVPTWSHFDFEKGRIAWSNVAKAISQFEKVKMIVHPDNKKNAKSFLDKLGNPYKKIILDKNGTNSIEWGASFVKFIFHY